VMNCLSYGILMWIWLFIYSSSKRFVGPVWFTLSVPDFEDCCLACVVDVFLSVPWSSSFTPSIAHYDRNFYLMRSYHVSSFCLHFLSKSNLWHHSHQCVCVCVCARWHACVHAWMSERVIFKAVYVCHAPQDWILYHWTLPTFV
jgi:hypothetical protein